MVAAGDLTVGAAGVFYPDDLPGNARGDPAASVTVLSLPPLASAPVQVTIGGAERPRAAPEKVPRAL